MTERESRLRELEIQRNYVYTETNIELFKLNVWLMEQRLLDDELRARVRKCELAIEELKRRR